jgi:hypothetical protein
MALELRGARRQLTERDAVVGGGGGGGGAHRFVASGGSRMNACEQSFARCEWRTEKPPEGN